MFCLAIALQVAWAALAGQAAGGQESAAPEPGLGRHDIVILRAPGVRSLCIQSSAPS